MIFSFVIFARLLVELPAVLSAGVLAGLRSLVAVEAGAVAETALLKCEEVTRRFFLELAPPPIQMPKDSKEVVNPSSDASEVLLCRSL